MALRELYKLVVLLSHSSGAPMLASMGSTEKETTLAKVSSFNHHVKEVKKIIGYPWVAPLKPSLKFQQ